MSERTKVVLNCQHLKWNSLLGKKSQLGLGGKAALKKTHKDIEHQISTTKNLSYYGSIQIALISRLILVTC